DEASGRLEDDRSRIGRGAQPAQPRLVAPGDDDADAVLGRCRQIEGDAAGKGASSEEQNVGSFTHRAYPGGNIGDDKACAATISSGARRCSASSGDTRNRDTERLTAPSVSLRGPMIAAPSETSLGKISSTASA